MLTKSEIEIIEKKFEAVKALLDDVYHIAEGKDNNVAFLVHYKSKDLDSIVQCAKLKSKD